MKRIELNENTLTPINTSLEVRNGVARVAKINKLDQDDANTYIRVDGNEFHNGIIEVDVCGKLLENAPAHARGFIGIVFRVNQSNSEFESFYIRPTNGIGCEDPIRRAHGCQYFSFPGYTFSYFREFGIEQYENRVDTIALNKWSHLKAVVRDANGEFYVDDHLVLTVNDLKHGDSAGCIGLYVDIGTDGYFKNLTVSFED